MKKYLFLFLVCINSAFANFFQEKFGIEDPALLSKTFMSHLQQYKDVEPFNYLNKISEEEKGFAILNFSLYARGASKKECDESTKNFLQNIASHALAIAAIKKDSSALGCIGNCSKTAMITLENKDLDLSILSLSNIKQKKEYKYLTSLIKERWVIGKKK
jgi:hypothetical protein